MYDIPVPCYNLFSPHQNERIFINFPIVSLVGFTQRNFEYCSNKNRFNNRDVSLPFPPLVLVNKHGVCSDIREFRV